MTSIEKEVLINFLTNPELAKLDRLSLKGRWYKIIHKVFKPSFGIEIEIPSSNIDIKTRDNFNYCTLVKYSDKNFRRIKKNPSIFKKLIKCGYYFQHNNIEIGTDCSDWEFRAFCSTCTFDIFNKVIESLSGLIDDNKQKESIYNLHIHIPINDFEYSELKRILYEIKQYPNLWKIYIKLSYNWRRDTLTNTELFTFLLKYKPNFKTLEYRGMQCDLNYQSIIQQLFLMSLIHKLVLKKDIDMYLELINYCVYLKI